PGSPCVRPKKRSPGTRARAPRSCAPRNGSDEERGELEERLRIPAAGGQHLPGPRAGPAALARAGAGPPGRSLSRRRPPRLHLDSSGSDAHRLRDRHAGEAPGRADAEGAPAPAGGLLSRRAVADRAAGGAGARHAASRAGAGGLLGGDPVSPRLRTVLVLGGLWVAAIAGRLYQLQVASHDHYVAKAERQQQRVGVLDPPRGTIYDAQGRELAVSVQVDSAYAVPPQIEDPADVARQIARVVPEVDARKLARQLAQDREFVWVARKLDPPVAAALRALQLPGLYFLPESKRYYPMRELAAQVLGYVGTDNHGLAGLELLYDEQVAGKPGVRTVLRDARRGTVVYPDLSFAEPEPGQDLHLTLDAAVQFIVERELARAVEERGAARGSAVFLDPSTGAVLAMATYPSFDPNRFGEFAPGRWRNRVTMDVYEPGSTFKVITAAAAIESGKVRPDDVFDC